MPTPNKSPSPTPESSGPTPQELIVKTTEFSKLYLEKLLDVFSSRENINEAVKDRRTLIVNPSIRNVNDANLDMVDDQFDEKGNKIPESTFTQHSPERAKTERNEFLRAENISEREGIAVIAAYFAASTDIILNNPHLIYVSKLVEAVRATVANELRDSAGFTEPKGFEPKKAMLDKITFLLENPFDLVNKTICYFHFFPSLKKTGDDAKKFSEGHIQAQINKKLGKPAESKPEVSEEPKNEKPVKDKAEHLKVKKNLLDRTHQAVEEFAQTFDANKLVSTMIDIKREDDGRHGKKKKASAIISTAASIAQKYLSSLNNTAAIGHSSVVVAGMYGRSTSASPQFGSTPMSPSPDSSGSSSEDEDEDKDKKTPGRSPGGSPKG
jgi:hypothetical protein